MTRDEFARVMGYLSAACGKPMTADAAEVYYDLLGDLDVRVLQCAARRVALEHPWHTFPSVAEIRQAASETTRGKVNELSAAEAWEIAWKAAGRIDLEIDGSVTRACEGLPAIVVDAMKAFGIPALCYGNEPVTVVRAQFQKFYEQLAARDRRIALLPDSVRREVAAIGKEARQAVAGPAAPILKIGRMPDDADVDAVPDAEPAEAV